jgi:CDP-paratose 2-epimerase
MRALITGGAGFVGGQLALHLKSRGHHVLAMDNLARRGSEINLARFRRHAVEFQHGDVRSREDFAGLPARFDVICECSAQPSVLSGYANPLFDITNNALGLVNVLEYARAANCPVIFWSSSRVYSAEKINALPRRETPTRLAWDGAPPLPQPVPGFDPQFGIAEDFSVDGGRHSIYGLSKVMADLACQEYADAFGVNTVINRFGVLSGPGQFGKTDQGWVAWWAAAFHFGLPLKYIGWGGKQVRDIVFIEDVCRLVELQMEQMERIRGQVFNLGGGRAGSLSLLEATHLLREKTGRDVAITVEGEPRKADQAIFISDSRKAERVLGWKPHISVSEGYDRILAWLKENEAALRPLYVSG